MFSGHVHLYLFLLLLLDVDSSFRKKTGGAKRKHGKPHKTGGGGKVLLQMMSYSPPIHLIYLTTPGSLEPNVFTFGTAFQICSLDYGWEFAQNVWTETAWGRWLTKNLETQKAQHKMYRKESGDDFFWGECSFSWFSRKHILGTRFTWKVSETPNFEPKTTSPKKQGESSFLKNDDGFPIDRLKFPLPGGVISVCHL